ncbi:uncharacterized protein LOC119986901 [Tripterygium wilfordii]|uniref:uncharacterized protein LOC119986901 n=1 Tax=Tripterygium wilfordii TaxID=458696 RepID=UPI0018F7E59F|nr:uncharacterized protein LOC119986901 [Tripterygium wilfordii]
MTSYRNQDFSYEYEYDYSQSAPWVDCTQTTSGNSSSRHQLLDVNVTLIPEMRGSKNTNHFEEAVANNDVKVEDKERYIESDASDAEDEDDDVVGDIAENVGLHTLLTPQILEFGDGTEGDLEVKQVFKNKAELLNAVKVWHIENNYQYKTQRSNTEIVQLKCMKDKTCRWYLRARAKESLKMWMITTCVAAIQAFATTQLKHEVSYYKAWMAKQKAMEKLFGSFEASYVVLPKFFEALKMSNPGTVVLFEHKNSNNTVATFGQVFWAFRPCIEGFQYCRPLISIDGTHLYGKYKGKLLLAVAFDADNGLFPLCYALVDAENNRNWSWFINCIRAYVTDCRASNVMTKFKDSDLKSTVNIMGREKSREKFYFWMTNLKELNAEAWHYLNQEDKERWALSYDDGH